MNYPGLPFGMWLLFHRSFRKKLISVLGFSPLVAAETKKKARAEYRASPGFRNMKKVTNHQP